MISRKVWPDGFTVLTTTWTDGPTLSVAADGDGSIVGVWANGWEGHTAESLRADVERWTANPVCVLALENWDFCFRPLHCAPGDFLMRD
jgi:hypothetical protein